MHLEDTTFGELVKFLRVVNTHPKLQDNYGKSVRGTINDILEDLMWDRIRETAWEVAQQSVERKFPGIFDGNGSHERLENEVGEMLLDINSLEELINEPDDLHVHFTSEADYRLSELTVEDLLPAERDAVKAHALKSTPKPSMER